MNICAYFEIVSVNIGSRHLKLVTKYSGIPILYTITVADTKIKCEIWKNIYIFVTFEDIRAWYSPLSPSFKFENIQKSHGARSGE